MTTLPADSTPTPDAPVAVAAQGSVSPRRAAWRRFRRNPRAVLGLIVLIAVTLLVIIAPLLTPSPTAVDLLAVNQPPGGAHPLGTDGTGRDVWSRLVNGGRVSLLVGYSTAAVAVLVGVFLGTLSGYLGGAADTVIMRVADLFLSIPAVVVAIVLAGIFGPSLPMLVGVIAGFSWPNSCRIARSAVLSLKELDYVAASRSMGASIGWIQLKHLLPGVLPPITVAGTLLVAEAILTEAALSFLGVGVVPPTPSWGNMLLEAQSLTTISARPWLWVPPGLAIAVTVLAINALGDGLGDVFDPRQTER
ncbi:ABC transporter permease [Nigerium massiliense]|uniref:ABC transporter permease n=1 Tax=Nigerium massiliense TaxID=1522317 RepID=UPI00058FBAD2|nr:ABC transporter permease [Nigerium massiliense]